MNDGSSDNSAEIIEEFAKKDSRIIVITQENKGLSEARNVALDIAKGEWITGIDSDDYIEPDMFDYLSSYIVNTTVKLVITGFDIIKDNKVIAEKSSKTIKYSAITPDLIINNECYFWAKLWHRDCITSMNVRFPKNLIFEDAYFYYCITPYLEEILFLPRVMYHYMRNDGQSSITDCANISHTYNLPLMDIVEKILEHYNKYTLPSHMSSMKVRVIEKYYGRLCTHLSVDNQESVWRRLQKIVVQNCLLEETCSHPNLVLQYFLNPCIVAACQKLYTHTHQFSSIRGMIQNCQSTLSSVSIRTSNLQTLLNKIQDEISDDRLITDNFLLKYNKTIQGINNQVVGLEGTLNDVLSNGSEILHTLRQHHEEIQNFHKAKEKLNKLNQHILESQEKLSDSQQQLQISQIKLENLQRLLRTSQEKLSDSQQILRTSQQRDYQEIINLYRLFNYGKKTVSFHFRIAILQCKKFFTWGKIKQHYIKKLDRIHQQIRDYKLLKEHMAEQLEKFQYKK